MELVERLRAVLAEVPEVRLAVLFGSAARGQAAPGSDLDVLLALEPDTDALRRQVSGALVRAVHRDVDVVHAADAKPLLRFEIARDGIMLAARDPSAWTDFKARAMLDWWDWAPYARRIHAAAVRRLREQVGHGAA
jgi:predicted nucleotidyltransferase